LQDIELAANSQRVSTCSPVFETILAHATRICGAKFGMLNLYDGESFCTVAFHNAPAEYGPMLPDPAPSFLPACSASSRTPGPPASRPGAGASQRKRSSSPAGQSQLDDGIDQSTTKAPTAIMESTAFAISSAGQGITFTDGEGGGGPG
jgi:hypothetical protein